MAGERDYYLILGIPEDATASEVRSAYRSAARAHHPDLNPGDDAAVDRFKQVQQAYDVLGDPTRRAAYQRARRSGGAGPGGPASSHPTPGSQPTGSYAAAWGMGPRASATERDVPAGDALNPELLEALLLLRAMIRRAELERRFRHFVRVMESW